MCSNIPVMALHNEEMGVASIMKCKSRVVYAIQKDLSQISLTALLVEKDVAAFVKKNPIYNLNAYRPSVPNIYDTVW